MHLGHKACFLVFLLQLWLLHSSSQQGTHAAPRECGGSQADTENCPSTAASKLHAWRKKKQAGEGNFQVEDEDERGRRKDAWSEARPTAFGQLSAAYAATLEPFPFGNTCGTEVQKHLVVIPQHKVLLCFIPKVATTKIQELALRLIGPLPGVDNYLQDKPLLDNGEGMREVKTQYRHAHATYGNPELIRAALEDDTYLRIAVVRNPFSKLLSAYKEKVEHDDDFQWNRERAQLQGLPKPTFAEFVRRIRDTAQAATDEHWRLQSCFCHFRSHQHKYDHILDKNDVHKMYEMIVAHSRTAAVMAPENPFKTWTSHTTNASAQDLQWDERVVLDLLEHYLEDFVRFGYSLDPTNQTCARCSKP